MKRQLILLLLFLVSFVSVFAHGKHQDMENDNKQEKIFSSSTPQPADMQMGRPLNWMQWIGNFHFMFLHFPIALIMMTGVSEILWAWSQRPIFDYASRFMLIAAAILGIPTALLGLILSFVTSFSGLLGSFVWWHMWAGISTALFAIIVVFIRQRKGVSKLYYVNFFVLFLLVNITGYLGGGMTFGPYHILPPM